MLNTRINDYNILVIDNTENPKVIYFTLLVKTSNIVKIIDDVKKLRMKYNKMVMGIKTQSSIGIRLDRKYPEQLLYISDQDIYNIENDVSKIIISYVNL